MSKNKYSKQVYNTTNNEINRRQTKTTIRIPYNISQRIKNINEKHGSQCMRNISNREIKYFILD